MSAPRKLPGSLETNRLLERWLRINRDGTVTICTGKVEIGQGILTAVAQAAADELDVALDRIRLEPADTGHSPDVSVNSRLLRRPVVMTLCLECHNGGGTGTRNQGVDVQTPQHNLLDPKYQRCTMCHVRIHGSNADEYFKR